MDTNNNIQKAKNVPPFVRYCSAIIPTMFDDSLSYYEALCALNKFLQTNVIDTINNNAEVTQSYIELTNQLQEFVTNYFDNLDVQTEINRKLDEMARDGELSDLIGAYVDAPLRNMQSEITSFTNTVSNEITRLTNEVDAKVSGTPTAVSSTAGMTDTSKIYVNTSDGKWYYYANGTWTIGGVYQSTGIDTGAVKRSNVEFATTTDNLFNRDSYSLIHVLPSTDSQTGTLTESGYSSTIIVPVSGSTTYSVQKNAGQCFAIYECENLPAVGGAYIAMHGTRTATSTKKLQFTTQATTAYLAIFCYNQGRDSNLSLWDVVSTLMVRASSTYADSYYPHYVLNLQGYDYPNSNIPLKALKDCERTPQLFNKDNYTYANILYRNGSVIASPGSYYVYIPCNGNTTYTVEKFINTSRFQIITTATVPTAGVTVIDSVNTENPTSAKILTVTTSASARYLAVFIYNTGADPNYNLKQCVNNLTISQGSEAKGLLPYYGLPFYPSMAEDYSMSYKKLAFDAGAYMTMSMVRRLGAVGDSYTDGRVRINGTGYNPSTMRLGWLEQLGRRNGNDNTYNFGVGGASTRSYLTDVNGLPKVLASDKCDLYYLALGINDANQLGTSYLGSISDINDDDYTLNPDTFYGNYGKIIQQIKNYAPYAKFIMITCMRPDTMNEAYGTFSNAIKEIANHYNFDWISPRDDIAFASASMSVLSGNHPTSLGYSVLAGMIEKETVRKMNANASNYISLNLQSLSE